LGLGDSKRRRPSPSLPAACAHSRRLVSVHGPPSRPSEHVALRPPRAAQVRGGAAVAVLPPSPGNEPLHYTFHEVTPRFFHTHRAALCYIAATKSVVAVCLINAARPGPVRGAARRRGGHGHGGWQQGGGGGAAGEPVR